MRSFQIIVAVALVSIPLKNWAAADALAEWLLPHLPKISLTQCTGAEPPIKLEGITGKNYSVSNATSGNLTRVRSHWRSAAQN